MVDDLLEDLPAELVESMADRAEWREQMASEDVGLEFIVNDLDRWKPGSVVTVAFNGGGDELHRSIAETVAAIDSACGIELDFGVDAAGSHRRWSTDDSEYAADIRIGFDKPGYWSLVGTASVDPSIGRSGSDIGGRPHQQSMNFGGFDRSLPGSWRRTVLHEFLHALAFMHEHQNMRGPCQDEFRWEDDAFYEQTTDAAGRYVADTHGRRPGIYTYLSGPPNQWPKAKVDHNLRSDGAEGGVAGTFDAESVMLYRFPPLFYKSDPSSCAPVGKGETLSDGDRRGLALLYPADAGSTSEAVDRIEHRASAALAALNSNDGGDDLERLGPDYAAGTRALLERVSGR